MNWQSAEVLANIDKLILEKGYGCQVELVPGDTVPTATSMTEKGKPDIAPELWLSSVKEPIEKAVKEGRLHIAAAALKDGALRVGGFHSMLPMRILRLKPLMMRLLDLIYFPQ